MPQDILAQRERTSACQSLRPSDSRSGECGSATRDHQDFRSLPVSLHDGPLPQRIKDNLEHGIAHVAGKCERNGK